MAVIPLSPVTSNTKAVSEEIPGFPKAAFSISANNTDTFSAPVTVFVGTGGNVAVATALQPSTPIVFKNIAAGRVVPVQVIRVYETNTTATDLVGIY